MIFCPAVYVVGCFSVYGYMLCCMGCFSLDQDLHSSGAFECIVGCCYYRGDVCCRLVLHVMRRFLSGYD